MKLGMFYYILVSSVYPLLGLKFWVYFLPLRSNYTAWHEPEEAVKVSGYETDLTLELTWPA